MPYVVLYISTFLQTILKANAQKPYILKHLKKAKTFCQ